MRKLILLSVLIACAFGNEQPSRLVNIAQGPVRGYKDPEYDVFAFHGVPYATAPRGVDKFKAPLSPPVWQEPFEAVNKYTICHQEDILHILPETLKKEEECLVASIYTPDTDAGSIPVVVFVHGGAYFTGFGNMVDPRPLVNTKKVMVVTFNYRVAAHGFLCLGTDRIPGNAGMKDQVALLRWVQNNIASFGGSPKDVTIVGSSAGSSSVDLLMISKMAKGLFNKVIPESGANTAAFSVQQDPITSAKEYAKLIKADVDISDVIALEEYYTTIPIEHLNSMFPLHKNDSTFILGPCVERDIGNEIFLHDSPISILKSGDYKKLPMLYGFANMEGLLKLLFKTEENIKSDLENMNNNFVSYLPGDLRFDNDNEKNEVSNIVKTHFFGSKVNEEDILDFVDYFSDVYIVYSTLRSVKLQVEAGNNQIYLYEYSFTEENDPYSAIPFTKVRGANHGAQTMAVWGSTLNGMAPTNVSQAFQKVRDTVRDMWINFITTGNPAPEGSGLPEWPPVGNKWSPHMSIGKALELRGSLLKERVLFWEEIYSKYYWTPQPPPPSQQERTEL